MNDMFLFGSTIACALGLIGALIAYGIYGGVHGSLSSARVGEFYNFEYLQPNTGECDRFLVKVVGVSRLTNEQISKLNARSNYRRYDSAFQRTNHLITGQSADGKIRNFYAERTVNCRRPVLAGAVFKTGLANLLF